MSGAANVLLGAVVDDSVPVAFASEMHVVASIVGHDPRANPDELADQRQNRLGNAVGDDARNDLALSFDHAEYDLLVIKALLVLAADEGFVDFDDAGSTSIAANRSVAVDIGHVFSDQPSHAPSGLVRHAHLPLDFLCRHAVTGGRKKEHGEEPLLQRRPRQRERCSDHRMNVVAAVAGVGRHLRQLVERVYLAALRARRLPTVPDLEEMFQAGIVIREPAEKSGDCQRLGHVRLPVRQI